jgi:4'-phosphopantetheinyl transferase
VISAHRCGIDMELQRDKVKYIADKYMSDDEFSFVDEKHEVKNLITIWSVKEAVYKLVGLPGLSFKDHILITSLSSDSGKVTADVQLQDKTITLEAGFEEIESFVLAYSIKEA